MNLDFLATKDNADSGVWTELVLYNKKTGVEICVLGNDSDAVQKFNREQVKKIRISTGRADTLDDDAIDTVLDSGDDGIVVRIAGIRSKKPDDPIVLLGKTIGHDEASLRFLVEKIPAVKDFVLKYSGERANFLQNGKKNSN
jgi:hypothetical protein